MDYTAGYILLTNLILQEKQQVPDKRRDACKLIKFSQIWCCQL